MAATETTTLMGAASLAQDEIAIPVDSGRALGMRLLSCIQITNTQEKTIVCLGDPQGDDLVPFLNRGRQVVLHASSGFISPELRARYPHVEEVPGRLPYDAVNDSGKLSLVDAWAAPRRKDKPFVAVLSPAVLNSLPEVILPPEFRPSIVAAVWDMPSSSPVRDLSSWEKIGYKAFAAGRDGRAKPCLGSAKELSNGFNGIVIFIQADALPSFRDAVMRFDQSGLAKGETIPPEEVPDEATLMEDFDHAYQKQDRQLALKSLQDLIRHYPGNHGAILTLLDTHLLVEIPSWGELVRVRELFDLASARSVDENSLRTRRERFEAVRDDSTMTPALASAELEAAAKRAQQLYNPGKFIAIRQHAAKLPTSDAQAKLLAAEAILSSPTATAQQLKQARAFLTEAKDQGGDPERIQKMESKLAMLEMETRGVSMLGNLAGKHRGERGVIIGNGPSLAKMDLSFLRDVPCFGLNRIYVGFERFGFIPTYFVSVDNTIVRQCADDMAQIPCTRMISSESWEAFPEQEKTIFLRSRISYDGLFSRDPRKGLFLGASGTYVCMQLAYYMGFSEIVLIGVDHRYTQRGRPHEVVQVDEDDPDHFDPNYYKGFQVPQFDKDWVDQAFLRARRYYEMEGRRIIDATVGGACEIFDKADYREVFGL